MNYATLNNLKTWFANYVATFKTNDTDNDHNIILKEDHTHRVCQEIRYIGENLGLNGEDLVLAEITALFHDVGRFEQYIQYGTFADSGSVNHAEFGVDILKEKQVLKDLNEPEQDLIFRAISYHNRRDLPSVESERCLFFGKLLRDADKLDIWQVFTAYYNNDNKNGDGTIVHNLPDTPGISESIYEELIARKIANYADARNLNDFKLLQVGWIYDVYFEPTLHRIYERHYLESIKNPLPQSKQIDEIFSEAHSYFTYRLESIK
ncbi:MAG: HD domain-containing protein [Chloroflexi bacterium]|nr:HD domain-containing protein [Chloroflexota bacterium]